MIVSRRTKIIAWFIVFLINAFFVLFTILRGMDRGRGWQIGFGIACFIQFLTEIFMYETIECIWVHFLIPESASKDIATARQYLQETIHGLCSETDAGDVHVLDSTRYMFVSTNVAAKFPDMLESMIIRSYHNHLPGKLSRNWRDDGEDDSVVRRFIHVFSLLTMTMTVLQYVGSSPSALQRAIIHLLNPVIFGFVFILVFVFVANPFYLSIFIIPVVYKLYRSYISRRASKGSSYEQRKLGSISPELGDRENSASVTDDGMSSSDSHVAAPVVLEGTSLPPKPGSIKSSSSRNAPDRKTPTKVAAIALDTVESKKDYRRRESSEEDSSSEEEASLSEESDDESYSSSSVV